MNILKNRNLITYLSIIALTLVSFYLDQGLPVASESRGIIMFMSNIKFLLVYFVFMEVIKAHKFWKFLGLILVFIQSMVLIIF